MQVYGPAHLHGPQAVSAPHTTTLRAAQSASQVESPKIQDEVNISDAARLVDYADSLDAGLTEAGTGEDPGDPPAHDHNIDVAGDRVALDERCERVVTVAGEVLVGPQVADVGAAGDEPLVALGEVLGADGLGVVAGSSAGSRRRSPSQRRGRRSIGPRHVPTLRLNRTGLV